MQYERVVRNIKKVQGHKWHEYFGPVDNIIIISVSSHA